MNFQKQIESSLFKKKDPSPFESYSRIIYDLAKAFHWTPQQINEMPISLVNSIYELLVEESKREASMIKKKR